MDGGHEHISCSGEIDHIREIIRLNDLRYSEKFEAAAQALALAAESTQRRFESDNKFRAMVTDYQATLMPRSEVMVMLDAMNKQIALLGELVAKREGRDSGTKNGWAYAIAAVGLFLSILAIMGKL